MLVLRIRDLLNAVAVMAVGLAIARHPIGRSVLLGGGLLLGALLACRYGLQASHAAWEAAGGSKAEDDLGAILKVTALFLLATTVVGLLALGSVLFFGLAVLRGLRP